MVVSYILGFLGFFLAGKFIRLGLIEPYDVIIGEGAIWLAWITLVFNVAADVYTKAKEQGSRCPTFPGSRRNSPLMVTQRCHHPVGRKRI